MPSDHPERITSSVKIAQLDEIEFFPSAIPALDYAIHLAITE
jgi:hypothetical protein